MIKFYYLKQRASIIADGRLGEHIEVKRSTHVLLDVIIPVEGAYAELEGHKLLTSEAHLLIPLLHCVIVVRLIVQGCRITYMESEFDIKLPENSESIAIKSAFSILSLINGSCA
jgi:hypothetical protein